MSDVPKAPDRRVEIHEFGPDDPALPAVAGFLHAEWGRPRGWSFTHAVEWLAAIGRSGSEAAFLARPAAEREQALGAALLVENDLPELVRFGPWLSSLYVRPDRRGEGIGGRLVETVLDRAARRGAGALYLYAPGERLADFYARWGFRKTTPFSRDGVDYWIMRRPLP